MWYLGGHHFKSWNQKPTFYCHIITTLSDPRGDKDYRVPHTKQAKVRSRDISIDAISKMRTDIKWLSSIVALQLMLLNKSQYALIKQHEIANLSLTQFTI